MANLTMWVSWNELKTVLFIPLKVTQVMPVATIVILLVTMKSSDTVHLCIKKIAAHLGRLVHILNKHITALDMLKSSSCCVIMKSRK